MKAERRGYGTEPRFVSPVQPKHPTPAGPGVDLGAGEPIDVAERDPGCVRRCQAIYTNTMRKVCEPFREQRQYTTLYGLQRSSLWFLFRMRFEMLTGRTR
jgi:hypothetical protein